MSLHLCTITYLQGDAAACDRLRVERALKDVDIQSVYHVPDVVAGGSYLVEELAGRCLRASRPVPFVPFP